VSDELPRRIVFSSAALPRHVSERRRRALWRDVYSSLYGPLDMTYAEGRPFSVRIELTRFGALEISRVAATIERYVRTRQCVAAAESDHLALAVNVGKASMHARQMGRDGVIPQGGAALLCNATAGEVAGRAGNAWLFLQVPRAALLTVITGAEDLVSRPIDAGLPAMRCLRRYLETVLLPDDLVVDAPLNDHIERTIVDLMALALGAGHNARDLSRTRGSRAAKLNAIAAEIRAGCLSPGCSIGTVAARVGLSARSVQDILHDTGRTFTDRMTELRLQRARALLGDHRNAGQRIVQIALQCGFNEVAHFNRAFRRRFDMSPSEMRAAP
jgi:AraC-like DNA-binding protein